MKQILEEIHLEKPVDFEEVDIVCKMHFTLDTNGLYFWL